MTGDKGFAWQQASNTYGATVRGVTDAEDGEAVLEAHPDLYQALSSYGWEAEDVLVMPAGDGPVHRFGTGLAVDAVTEGSSSLLGVRIPPTPALLEEQEEPDGYSGPPRYSLPGTVFIKIDDGRLQGGTDGGPGYTEEEVTAGMDAAAEEFLDPAYLSGDGAR